MKKELENISNVEWYIYEFLKERSAIGIWTSQDDLIEYLKRIKNVSICKRVLRRYISNIRKCERIEKIILTDYRKGYMVMSDEQEIEYLKRRKESLLKSLKQYYHDVRRFNNRNKIKITFSDNEREFYESLINRQDLKGSE